MSAVVSYLGRQASTGRLVKVTNASAAATAMTVSSPINNKRLMRLAAVYVKYSANATVDIDITLNAVEGAAYDTRIQRMSITAAQHAVFMPDGTDPIYVTPGDTIDVLAPSGGGALTSQVRIVLVEE